MVYDKAKWHFGGNFPKGLPPENGGTHIGMFLAWAINHGMASPELAVEAGSDLEAVRRGETTGRAILFRHLDGVLSDEDLSGAGNLFTAHYYKNYQAEYDGLIRKRLPSAYHAADDQATYNTVAAMIDNAYSKFLKSTAG